MSEPPVLVQRAGPVGQLVLNRPNARNAVTVQMATALADIVTELTEEVRVIILRGAGADFCAGGDVHALAALHAQGRAAMAPLFTEFRRALTAITSAPVPVVAAVHGHAAAGGLELMLACDIAVVSSDAVIADLHNRFGHVPGGGSTQRLPRTVGRQRAMGLVLTGDSLSGEQAAAWGLAYRAVPPGRLDAEVGAIVDRLLANSSASMARSKALVHHAQAAHLDDGLTAETTAVLDHLNHAGAEAFAAFHERKADR